mmetsp:Transcript_67928/g.153628  ORF Transcript_67928/g.153628 Transcript_67928/m.153628 type:complete len:123 (-) Transcript_67928:298-666(-)
MAKSHAAPLAILAFLAVVAPAAATTWVKGGGASSCETVCQARSGCNEEAWPTSAEEFEKIASEAGQVCETTQEGGAKYDPSTDGHHCGWSGPEHPEGEETRCSLAPDSGTYRFCPCNSDKEL